MERAYVCAHCREPNTFDPEKKAFKAELHESEGHVTRYYVYCKKCKKLNIVPVERKP